MLADAQRNNEKTDTKLIFHTGMNNKTTVVLKYTDVFLLPTYMLSQLGWFLPPWYIEINSNQFFNINDLQQPGK